MNNFFLGNHKKIIKQCTRSPSLVVFPGNFVSVKDRMLRSSRDEPTFRCTERWCRQYFRPLFGFRDRRRNWNVFFGHSSRFSNGLTFQKFYWYLLCEIWRELQDVVFYPKVLFLKIRANVFAMVHLSIIVFVLLRAF